MKKILFLLLSTVAMYGQVPADATPLENIQITNNTQSTTATKVNVQEANGTINTISKSDLVNVVEVNDVPSLPLVGEVGKIYVVKNVNKIYRWNGTFYQELAGSDISGLQAQIDLKENAFTKNTAFNKNFGTTAGTVVEGNDGRINNGQTAFGWGNHAGLYPSLTGAGANGTWGINISGSASSATNWGGIYANFVNWEDTPQYLLGTSAGVAHYYNQQYVRNFLGLGSNAYSSTAYLPLTGGTLSGALNGTSANFSSSVTATSFNGSATLTGTPTAPTAPAGTNTTQIATTAFVLANSSARPYKVYTALLTQTGTNAPVATVLENTLGGTVVWTRTSNGVYDGTLTGAFASNKTTIQITGTVFNAFFAGFRNDDNTVTIGSSNTIGIGEDNLILSSTIEIRVYL